MGIAQRKHVAQEREFWWANFSARGLENEGKIVKNLRAYLYAD